MTDVRIRSRDQTVRIELGTGKIDLSFWRMLLGQVRLKRVELDDLRISITGEKMPKLGTPRLADSGRRTAPTGTAPAIPNPDPAPDHGRRAARLLEFFSAVFPIPCWSTGSRFVPTSTASSSRSTSPSFIRGLHFETRLVIETARPGQPHGCLSWPATSNAGKNMTIRLAPLRESNRSLLPFIDRQWGLRVSFDSLTIGLKSGGRRRGVLRLDGSLAVGGLTLHHPRIAGEDVNLENAAIDYVLNIGADYFELDGATLVRFNKLSFHPYFKLKTRPTRQLTLKLAKTRFKADDLFSSLPAGLFTRLAGIQTSGELAYEFDFFVDFSRPEQLTLQANLEKTAFRIKRFGRVDFRDVNEPFVYTAYEKDRALRSFMVGPENPDFRSLDQFPSYLKNAVMISEDGAFFGHSGFLLGPIKDSIAANIKDNRFVRGASTISMQLVKNLYLKRQKTIARKFEEMLITWLIEDNRLISKERMYEIYLNIIEWGPGCLRRQGGGAFLF